MSLRLARLAPLAAVAVAMLSATAGAQSGTASKSPSRVEIPRGLRPPAGMCRIWIDSIPAARQPAPTDCPTAIRNRPPNGRVIFADDKARKQQVPPALLAPKAEPKPDPRKPPPPRG